MQEPEAFCRSVLHEYERQWARATGHGVRHPLRLKMERLGEWCAEGTRSPEAFEQRLREAQQSEDIGTALLGEELLGLWSEVRAGRPPRFLESERG